MKYSWTQFIEEVSKRYSSGLSEKDISQSLGGISIKDSGVIERIDTDPEYTQFIQVRMPKVEVPYGSKVIYADFLCLNFEKLTDEDVAGLSEGDSLDFETFIIKSNGPFNGIGISEYEDDDEIIIMPGTSNTKIA